jgi:hypothetical protein
MRLPQGWREIDREEASKLEVELQRELSSEHVLRGLPLVALARREQSDDVLFGSFSREGKVYWVHLTWVAERFPKFPWTVPYTSVDRFADQWPEDEYEDD